MGAPRVESMNSSVTSPKMWSSAKLDQTRSLTFQSLTGDRLADRDEFARQVRARDYFVLLVDLDEHLRRLIAASCIVRL